MVFSSIEFIFFFLPLFLLCYYISPCKLKNTVILLFSLGFYFWGEAGYILLIMFSSLFGYISALLLEKLENLKKKLFLAFAVLVNISVLGYFKYTNFITGIFHGFNKSISVSDIALPIGISFFTFQVISYIIDVYRGNIKAQKNPFTLMTYITMFPQLIAGPIVRYSEVSKDLDTKRKVSIDDINSGLRIFLKGLFKKVLIANNIGILWENIKGYDITSLSLASAWLGAVYFSLQLYFDFGGYADMAIGLGKMIGFKFVENFNYPYIASSITDFWRRWHMSLSRWFRDYVYIPLGGNRKGVASHIFNLLVVWTLTGIWHGASWNFIFWGLYYGIILIGEKYIWGKGLKKIPKVFAHIYTLIIVVVGFTVFVFDDINSLLPYMSVMFSNTNGILIDNMFVFTFFDNIILLIFAVIFSTPLPEKLYKNTLAFSVVRDTVFVALFILSVVYIVNSSYNPFLYFRF
ncbi:MAG: MBOAT family protein [Firmicutes bacterium]|nr:MBOAT family protein [Bacillota bacterium]